MNNYEISALRTRYIVPFEIDIINNSFNEICERIDNYIDYPYSFLNKTNKVKEGRWIRESLRQRNQDVYGYIIDEFSIVGDIDFSKEIDKSGCYWHYSLFEKEPFKMDFVNKDIRFPIELNDMGLYIFRSGVGLLWYEIDTKDNIKDSESLIIFQNMFKQLDRAYDNHLRINNEYFEFENELPLILGSYFAERLAFLNIRFQSERKNVYHELLREHIKEFNEEELIDILPAYCPDKAILFSYVVFERDNDWIKDNETLKTAYYLTNGYKESYEMAEDIKDTVGNPFSNVYWIASKEGCGYFAWEREDNKDFFKNHQYYKIMDDYFLLFIRALFQSSSLMKYAIYTSKTLPSDYHHYLTVSDKTEEIYDNISGIEAEINLFLVKSLATSVSHIQHQNEFYNYIIDRLSIKEDVNSVTAGLNVLNDMQNDTLAKKERKIQDEAERREKDADNNFQIGLALVTFLAGISAFADSYTLVDGLINNTFNGWSSILFVVLYIICIVILVVSLVLFIKTVKQFKKHKE